tara:strand:+ start:21 stop:623 length:603 start_codon:yes stop_codon:yes gene_type:complete
MSEKPLKDILLGGSLTFPTKISLNLFKGKKLIDIRKWFESKSTGELEPTKKGISLNQDAFNDLLNFFNSEQKEINKWFESKEKNNSQIILDNLIKKSEKIREEQIKKKEFTIQNQKIGSRSFFQIKAEGNKREVILNEDHSFIKNNINNKELILIISTMALTLQQALDNFDTSDKVSAAQFDEYLLDEWGMILNQYTKSK